MELFFVVSGFLTEYTYNSNESFKKWIFGKLSRYYPYAIIACIVCLGTAAVFSIISSASLLNLNYDVPTIITSLMLFHTGWIKEFSPAINNPTWYLCILTLCYLLFWLFREVISWKKKWIMFAVFAAMMIPAYFASTHGMNIIPFIRLGNVRGYGSFFTGCILCMAWRVIPKKRLILINAGLWILAISGMLEFGLSNWYVLTYLLFPALLLSLLLLPQIGNRFTKMAGAVSFEVYLWHVPIYSLLLTFFTATGLEIQHSWLSMTLFSLLIWFVAAGIHYGIDQPIAKRLSMRNE